MSYATVGEWMRSIRAERGLRQNEAAARSKMAVAQLSRYEAGKKVPSVKTLARFAKAMACSLAEWNEVPLSSAWAEYGKTENEACGPIGEWIHSVRRKRGLTQTDAAQKMGVSQVTVSGYERNSTQPTAEKLLHFAREVHCTSDEWLGLLNTYAGGLPDRQADDERE